MLGAPRGARPPLASGSVHILRYSRPGSSRAHVGILDEGHTVRISVDQVGTLENPVVRGLAAMKESFAQRGVA